MSSPGPRLVRLRALLARGLGALARGEKAVLAIGVPMYIAVHREYAVRFFGEDDAANFATDAIFWHFSGSLGLDLTDYRLRTSPLYVRALERALHFGVPVAALPWFMTLSSIIASTVVLVAGYFLFRPLAGRAAAAACTGLLVVTPGMWLGATYGMAHLPALAFWMASLLLFSFALDGDPRTRGFWGLTAASVTCAFVALGFKADLILTGFAFPGLAFVKRRDLARRLEPSTRDLVNRQVKFAGRRRRGRGPADPPGQNSLLSSALLRPPRVQAALQTACAGLAGLFRGFRSLWPIAICSSKTDMSSRVRALPALVLSPAVPLAGLALQIGYGRLLAGGAQVTSLVGHSADSTMTFAAYWHKRFPFTLDALTTHRTTNATLSCAGPFLTTAALLALACLLFMPEMGRFGAWLSAWALPPMLFWALIDGNSARHNIGAMPPLMLALGTLLARVAETPLRVASLAGSLALMNYFSDTLGDPANLGTMVPRTNLLELSEQLFLRSEGVFRRASPFAGLQDEKKVAIDRHWLAWTIFAEAANAERRARVTGGTGRAFRIERPGAPPQSVRFLYADDVFQARRLAQQWRLQGFVTWSASFPL